MCWLSIDFGDSFTRLLADTTTILERVCSAEWQCCMLVHINEAPWNVIFVECGVAHALQDSVPCEERQLESAPAIWVVSLGPD